MFYEVWPAGKSFKGKGSLTYSFNRALSKGQVVKIAVRNSESYGVIANSVPKPDFSVKPLSEALDFKLTKNQLALIDWFTDYYPAPISSIVSLFLPASFGPPTQNEADGRGTINSDLPALTNDQKEVLSQINTNSSESILLRGDTGSGKTRIYIECAKKAIKNNKSVLILTPEIGLTSPLKEQFEAVFGQPKVMVVHSAMTPKEKSSTWQKIYSSTSPVILIGPRSALFAPINNLGLVVVDEAHDMAYKQEQQPYYLATRVASKLAKLHSCSFLMGTATPNIVDYFKFESGGLKILKMTKPAIKSRQKVEKIIIDLKDKGSFSKSALLSDQLLRRIAAALKNNEQSLVFLNRRGSARLIICRSCGWQARCPRCDVALTYHQDKHKMLCHSCGYFSSVPSQCPDCNSFDLLFKVGGTKAVESELSKLFPNARIHRFDKDTALKQRLHHTYNEIQSGKVDIVVGTQAVAKGFDLPLLSVIGIVQADSGLSIADYTAGERTYQLITQVAGRIGRGHRSGSLILQTYHPDSPLIKQALDKDYGQFYHDELANRLTFGFPPKFYLLKISDKKSTSANAQKSLVKLAAGLEADPHISIIGPAPRYPEKVGNNYRWQLIVRSKDRTRLADIVKQLPLNYTCDLDPSDLL